VRRWSRKKDDGTLRPIIAARTPLKDVQKSIKLRILDHLDLLDCAHAYRKGRSHVTAASAHLGCRTLLCADIRGFYPSIRPERVNAAWIAIGCGESAAKILTRLTTCDYQLPQGFATSNAIANLVRRDLDRRIQLLADSRNLTYTNFSDNLFISGKRVPQRVAHLCREIAHTYGWKLHEVTLRGPDEPKTIMGILVGDTLDVTPEYRTHVVTEIDTLRGLRPVPPALLAHIKGHVSYVSQINSTRACELRSLLDRALSGASPSSSDLQPRAAR